MQSNLLDIDLRSLDAVVQQLTARSMNVAAATPFLNQVSAGISALESKVSSTQATIKGMYDEFSLVLSQILDELAHIEWMLEQFSTATFQLLNTEAAVNVVKTVWEISGKETKGDPKGLLYLTDQRLLFEQKEEIATKKILFITTEKEKIHKLLFEFPIVLVERMKVNKEGFFKNEDHIDLELASGAPFPVVHFHLDGQDCNEWFGQIGKVKAREYDNDRVVAIKAEEIEKVKKAPSQCPSCGGVINRPVLRGMDTLTCDYCGYVIRL
jgi:ribosomal protein S27AE